jgi:exonuclease III
VRLITWNVNRRISVLAAQAAALAGREPDVVALQEVTERSWPLWRVAFDTVGLPHAACSLDEADPARQSITRRRTGVVIASRAPSSAADPLAVPWPETALAMEIDGVVVHTAHVPNAANGWIKPETLAALRAGLEAGSARACCAATSTRPAARSPTAP